MNAWLIESTHYVALLSEKAFLHSFVNSSEKEYLRKDKKKIVHIAVVDLSEAFSVWKKLGNLIFLGWISGINDSYIY